MRASTRSWSGTRCRSGCWRQCGTGFTVRFGGRIDLFLANLLAIAIIWLQPEETEPVFRTLTSTEPLPSGHYVRVVFDPTVDESGVTALFESSGLMLVSGPSERGVITLRFADDTDGDERDDIVRKMREDRRVLFAEAVESGK